MAIARDTAKGLGFGTSPRTVAYTCTGTNLILFVYTWENRTSTTITGITYNTVAMTAVNAGVTDGTSDYGKLWYLVGPATGAHNIVITTSSGSVGGVAASYTGVSQVAPEANNTNSANPGTGLTNTLNTIASNAWFISGISSDAASAISAGAGSNLVVDDNAATNSYFFDSNAGLSPGSNSMVFTCASQRLQSGFCSFAPFGSVATAKSSNLTLLGVG